MRKDQSNFEVRVEQSNGKRSAGVERADFTSFAKAPDGKPQQSLYETKWAAYQEWAAVERPDRQFAPCLTEEARQQLEAHRGRAND